MVGPPNIRVDPSPAVKGHDFDWCPSYSHFYSHPKVSSIVWPVSFSGVYAGEWELAQLGAFFEVDSTGLVAVNDGSPAGDSSHFWVCNSLGIYRVKYLL